MVKIINKIPLYPFLISVYPILYLLSVNVEEIGPEAGLRSGLLLLVFSLVTFGVSLLVTRTPRVSALVSLSVTLAFFLVFFLLYAPAYRALREVQISGETLGRHRYLVTITFLLLAAVGAFSTWLSKKLKPKSLKSITLVLNTLSIILVMIPALTMILQMIRNRQNTTQAQASLPPLEDSIGTLPNNAPDIYYLIFDMHTNDQVMRALMDYDNSEFTNALADRGFYIAPCSRSNYANTQFSITSSLNMNYIQALSDSYELAALLPLVQSSLVQRTLEDAGYQTYAFETGYPFTELRQVDRYYAPVEGAVDLITYPGLTPFESLVMQVSAGKILYESREQLSQKMQFILDAPYVQYRDRILYTLDTIPDLATEPGPKFVFAHILAPHDPFVFDEDGSTTFRRTPFQMDKDPEFGKGYGWEPYKAGYIEEIKYLHKRILEIVDTLQANSVTPPVIIIQGDHGLPRLGLVNAQYEIYNAYYPGTADTSFLYETVTPVNTFRLLFNALFGTSYELLPEESYQLGEDGVFSQFEIDKSCPAQFQSLPGSGED